MEYAVTSQLRSMLCTLSTSDLKTNCYPVLVAVRRDSLRNQAFNRGNFYYFLYSYS